MLSMLLDLWIGHSHSLPFKEVDVLEGLRILCHGGHVFK